MDLHAWITRQVDRVEASLEGHRVAFEPTDGGPAITGTVTGVTRAPDGLRLDIAQYDVEPRDETPVPVQSVTAVLRRCEADRRILARHRAAPVPPGSEWTEEYPYCAAHAYPGPGGSTVYPIELHDCPELLDLAHAQGITPDILATPPITTSDVPDALRGPGWKP